MIKKFLLFLFLIIQKTNQQLLLIKTDSINDDFIANGNYLKKDGKDMDASIRGQFYWK